MIKQKPAPPESITPASFSTAKSSGVCSKDTFAASKYIFKYSGNVIESVKALYAASPASLITVKIVPSVGI